MSEAKLNHLITTSFRKIPTWGSQIFVCITCQKERIFGYDNCAPANKKPLLLCEGSCKGYTLHSFVKVHRGREGTF